LPLGADRERARRRKHQTLVQAERLGVLALLLVIWKVAVAAHWIDPIYSATPRQTFSALFDMLKQHLFWSDLVVTLREAVIAWAVGSAAGLVVGLLLGRSAHAMKVAGPFLTFFNAVPKIALAPIIILWFGVGESSKIVTAILVVFFIVQVPTTAAVALVDPDLDTVATTMGATQLQRFGKVYFPGILPAVFGALRLAAVFSLLTVVFAEFLAAKQGLGQRLITATNQFQMADAFAVMIVLAALALAINGVVGLVERRVLRWQGTSRRGSVVSL
jgi:NitT/TauT family transport system permease protein